TPSEEGRDPLGLWGRGRSASGVDPDYLNLVEERAADAVRSAAGSLHPATAVLGTATAPELLHDGRPPIIKHDELVAVEFRDPQGGKRLAWPGRWTGHP